MTPYSSILHVKTYIIKFDTFLKCRSDTDFNKQVWEFHFCSEKCMKATEKNVIRKYFKVKSDVIL